MYTPKPLNNEIFVNLHLKFDQNKYIYAPSTIRTIRKTKDHSIIERLNSDLDFAKKMNVYKLYTVHSDKKMAEKMSQGRKSK